jgi:hypothetical protein
MSIIIHSLTLPPKDGYVEVEIDGVRQYQKVETEQDKQLAAVVQENAELREQITSMDGAFTDFLINVAPFLGIGE